MLHDGCRGKVRAALPDSSFVQLDELYRDRMKQRLPLRIGAVDVPAAWYPARASA
jgi:hypothetical protein